MGTSTPSRGARIDPTTIKISLSLRKKLRSIIDKTEDSKGDIIYPTQEDLHFANYNSLVDVMTNLFLEQQKIQLTLEEFIVDFRTCFV